jgi:hypothetical protein
VKEICLITEKVAGPCSRCGAFTDPAHLPFGKVEILCGGCCCEEKTVEHFAEDRPVEAAGERVPEQLVLIEE